MKKSVEKKKILIEKETILPKNYFGLARKKNEEHSLWKIEENFRTEQNNVFIFRNETKNKKLLKSSIFMDEDNDNEIISLEDQYC